LLHKLVQCLGKALRPPISYTFKPKPMCLFIERILKHINIEVTRDYMWT